MAKWTQQQRKRFSATMKAKKSQIIPLDAIPERPLAARPRAEVPTSHDPKLILAYELVKLLQRLV
jgi:hypothetical protein